MPGTQLLPQRLWAPYALSGVPRANNKDTGLVHPHRHQPISRQPPADKQGSYWKVRAAEGWVESEQARVENRIKRQRKDLLQACRVEGTKLLACAYPLHSLTIWTLDQHVRDTFRQVQRANQGCQWVSEAIKLTQLICRPNREKVVDTQRLKVRKLVKSPRRGLFRHRTEQCEQ